MFFRELWSYFFGNPFTEFDTPKVSTPYILTTYGKVFKIVQVNDFEQTITVRKGFFRQNKWVNKEEIILNFSSIDEYISEYRAKEMYSKHKTSK